MSVVTVSVPGHCLKLHVYHKGDFVSKNHRTFFQHRNEFLFLETSYRCNNHNHAGLIVAKYLLLL